MICTAMRLAALFVAMLVVAPALAQLNGRVEQHSFVGPVLGNTVLFNIYLPEEYDTGAERYPVIYFLHGLNGSQGGPPNTVVPRSYEDALAAGIIGPVIVVFPNGYLDSLWADSIDGAKPAETDVVRQLIPHVDANFRTVACANSRVITGFSMGGFGAPKFYAKFPELYAACVAYDGSLADWDTLVVVRPDWALALFGNDEAYFDQYSPWHWSTVNASMLLPRNDLRLVVAEEVDANRQFRDHLTALGISTDYVETGCPHDMNCMLAAQGMNSAAFIAARLGSPGGNGPSCVPTLSGRGLFLLALSLAGAACIVLRRRRNFS
jgi:endo-1,4-beta-xylanase